MNSPTPPYGEADLARFSEFDPDHEGLKRERRPLIGGSLAPRPFAVALTVITVGALVLRVIYVLTYTRHQFKTLNDSFWYYSTTIQLHLGQFFRMPFSLTPTAAHPPLTTLLVGAGTYITGLHRGITSSLLVMAVLGAAVVLCVGLLGRAVAGPWVGLIAAILAALSPNFWMPSGIFMSETPAMLFMALILLTLVHFLRSPTLTAAVLLGVLCGAEALVRAELILCVPGLLIPATLIAKVPLRRRLVLLFVGLAATTLVLAPWVGRNLATFKDPTYLSTGNGLVLLGANCAQTYYGPNIGLWSGNCVLSLLGAGDESQQSSRDQHAAVQYIEHHTGRLPLVMLVRVARVWDAYRPVQMAQAEENEGRPFAASMAGTIFNYALLPFAVAGIVILRKRRIDQWFLLVPAGIVTLTAALFYSLVRFRAPFEVCLVVLASSAIVALIHRLRARGSSEPAPTSL